MGPEIYWHRRYLLGRNIHAGYMARRFRFSCLGRATFGRGYMYACRQDVADALWRVSLVRDKVWPAS